MTFLKLLTRDGDLRLSTNTKGGVYIIHDNKDWKTLNEQFVKEWEDIAYCSFNKPLIDELDVHNSLSLSLKENFLHKLHLLWYCGNHCLNVEGFSSPPPLPKKLNFFFRGKKIELKNGNWLFQLKEYWTFWEHNVEFK